MIRRTAWAAAALTLSPTALAAVLLHPAGAAPPVPYHQIGVTALVAALRTEGLVGESGGLVTLDSAAASLVGRLDSAPSSALLAAPYEPGTLARTGVSEVNANAGSAVLAVPEARAHYPGAQTRSTLAVLPALSAGPVSASAGGAAAQAGASAVSGTASLSGLSLAGVLTATGATSALGALAPLAGSTVTQQADTRIATLQVAGVLTVSNLLATASVTADGDRHVATESLTIGGASVAGQQVRIGNDGVTAVGVPVLPAATLAQATDLANAALQAAGVTVQTVAGRTAHDGRSAQADSGGLALTVRTAALPAGIAGNTLTVLAGGISLTELDAPATVVPARPAGPALPLPAPGRAGPALPATFVAGTPDLPAMPGELPLLAGAAGPAPQVAALRAVPRSFRTPTVGDNKAATLLGLATLQFFTLALGTLYALIERQRRQAAAAAARR